MALAVRTWEAVVARNPIGASWPWWDLLLPSVSLLVAVATIVAQRTKRGAPSLVERLSPTTALAGTIGVALLTVVVAFSLRPDTARTVTTGEEAEDEKSTKKKDDDREKESHPPEKRLEDDEDAFAAWDQVAEAMKKGNWPGAVEGVEQVLKLDPDAAKDPAVRNALVKLAVRACLGNGPSCKSLMDLLSEKAGTAGPDVLFELIATKGKTNAEKRAQRLLKDPAVRREASDALRVAYALRETRSCADVEKLYPDIEKDGDHRALRELKILQSRQCRARGCCLNGQDAEVKRLERSLLDRAGD